MKYLFYQKNKLKEIFRNSRNFWGTKFLNKLWSENIADRNEFFAQTELTQDQLICNKVFRKSTSKSLNVIGFGFPFHQFSAGDRKLFHVKI